MRPWVDRPLPSHDDVTSKVRGLKPQKAISRREPLERVGMRRDGGMGVFEEGRGERGGGFFAAT